MNKDLTFGFEWARKATLEWYSSEPKGITLSFLAGGSNHLLWHLGHIYVIAENINEALGFPREHSQEWYDLFITDSEPQSIQPARWPEWHDIIDKLVIQREQLLERIALTNEHLLDSPNPKPETYRPHTVRGWITHTIRHETLHCGIMHQMLDQLNANG